MVPRVLTDFSTNPVQLEEWIQTVPTRSAHRLMEFWRNKTSRVDPRQNPFRARSLFPVAAFSAISLENQSPLESDQSMNSLMGIHTVDLGDT